LALRAVCALTVGIVGAGALGARIALRLRERGINVLASVRTEESRSRLESLGLRAYTDNSPVVEGSDVIILTVRPGDVKQVDFCVNKPLVSFVAGVPLDSLRRLSSRPYRAMTNIGLTLVAVSGEYDGTVNSVLSAIAPTVWVDERLVDPLTVLLGSGPAIVAELAAALVRAGVNVGIPWDLAKRAVLSLMESLPALDREFSMERVQQLVATPGGATIKALVEMAPAVAHISRAVEAALGRLSDIAKQHSEGLSRRTC
jgi:pyrroline-5-carboxylate reductase